LLVPIKGYVMVNGDSVRLRAEFGQRINLAGFVDGQFSGHLLVGPIVSVRWSLKG
jgi:hypothetical protein